MLTPDERKWIEEIKAAWDENSAFGKLVKIIERLSPPPQPRPVRSERAINKPFPALQKQEKV